MFHSIPFTSISDLGFSIVTALKMESPNCGSQQTCQTQFIETEDITAKVNYKSVACILVRILISHTFDKQHQFLTIFMNSNSSMTFYFLFTF